MFGLEHVVKAHASYMEKWPKCPLSPLPLHSHTGVSLPACKYYLIGCCLWSLDQGREDSGLVTDQFSSVQLLIHVRLFVSLWTAARQASLSIASSQGLLKLMSTESVMPSIHVILCHPLLPSSVLPSIRVFSNESVLDIRWPKCQSFSFSISPSNCQQSNVSAF